MQNVSITDQGTTNTCYSFAGVKAYEGILKSLGIVSKDFEASVFPSLAQYKSRHRVGFQAQRRNYFFALAKEFDDGRACDFYQILKENGICGETGEQNLGKKNSKAKELAGWVHAAIVDYHRRHPDYFRRMMNFERVKAELKRVSDQKLFATLESAYQDPVHLSLNKKMAEAYQKLGDAKTPDEVKQREALIESIRQQFDELNEKLGVNRVLGELADRQPQLWASDPEVQDRVAEVLYQDIYDRTFADFEKQMRQDQCPRYHLPLDFEASLPGMSQLIDLPTARSFLMKAPQHLFCGDQSQFQLPPEWKNKACVTESNSSAFKDFIQSELGKGKEAIPIQITYFADVLKAGKGYHHTEKYSPLEGQHDSLLIGMKPMNGSCYYLIRNSWGRTCKDYASPDWICDENDIWVEESALFKNTMALTNPFHDN